MESGTQKRVADLEKALREIIVAAKKANLNQRDSYYTNIAKHALMNAITRAGVILDGKADP